MEKDSEIIEEIIKEIEEQERRFISDYIPYNRLDIVDNRGCTARPKKHLQRKLENIES